MNQKLSSLLLPMSLHHFIGRPFQLVPTPCLLIDEKAYDRNLVLMKHLVQQLNEKVMIRAHFKAHKCPEIAKDQIERGGAIGVCCQKLSEAVEAIKTVDDVLISNQVVNVDKLRIIRNMNEISGKNVSLCVDNEQVVSLIDDIMSENNESSRKLQLVVEYNVGQNRCGTNSEEETLKLIKHIENCKHVEFKGLQCYNGANQHIVKYEDRKEAVSRVVEKVKRLLDYLSQHGVIVKYVTGGGTGTFEFEASSGVFTEVQPGSYLFGDADYGKIVTSLNGKTMLEDESSFSQSLYILTTIVSKVPNTRIVVDAGLKASSLDSGVPIIADIEQRKILSSYKPGGDEHGIFEAHTEKAQKLINSLNIGDVLRLIPGHVDPTFNMYDLVAFYNPDNHLITRVESITARGPGI
ncbi:hypothetical protein C9374_010911 [Naegleria lovaniensis]|uniref:D-serine dehydratase-like domain-containing protein n=1 Tax=Naegleria lovaniensis TaxID=51637 RepID=A0AA88GHQ8_NAELO|nr:uncharacterized protein C9374_010911 [Naegleria lovaniensis]KAG2374341.1 hypothetical protein C9374_010911 [Naegleria lovaniensis]